VTHVFTLSLIQRLPLEHVDFLRSLGKTLTKGWQILDITTLTTGPPFTVYSGIQQTALARAGRIGPTLSPCRSFPPVAWCARTTSAKELQTVPSS